MNMLKEFGRLALAVFKEPLAQHGFKREYRKTETFFCNIVFVNGERYIKLSANIHPRDFPPRFNIILGEGSRDALEADWNSIALWRLKNFILQTDEDKEYLLETPEELPALLEQAINDLIEFGGGFLNGDVELFRKARSEHNKDRQPYKVYTPDGKGNYTVKDEPISVKMKKKYS